MCINVCVYVCVCVYERNIFLEGLPQWLSGKESPCNAGIKNPACNAT